MKPKTLLVLATFLTLRAVAQDSLKSECKFSDGKTIRVMRSSDPARAVRFSTDGSLVTVKGVSVPAGDYIALPAWDSHNNWTLRMKGNGKEQLLPVPMSATTPTRPNDKSISFDSTGASCTLHWRLGKSNILLSLEFAEKNTDMPLLR